MSLGAVGLTAHGTRHLKYSQPMNCPDTQRLAREQHDTFQHAAFPDTSRSESGVAEWHEISWSRNPHGITYITQNIGFIFR